EFGTTHVRRIGGANRYAVSVGVADFAVATAGFAWTDPAFASGAAPADALAGGVHAGRRGAPVLLLGSDRVPDEVGAKLWSQRAVVSTVTFFGGPNTIPDHVRIEVLQALDAPLFSVSRAMAHVKAIAALGPRAAGGSAERKAAEYIAGQLRSYGYSVTVQTGIPIPGGKTTRNVIAEKAGSEAGVIVLGAHMDSKSPSPGANDNASGVAVTLEIARVLAQAEGLVPTVRFIAFGAEEIAGATSDDHHFGSRHYVANLSSAAKARIESMMSIDMVGYGATFNVRNLGVAPMTTVASLRKWARFNKQALPYLADPSRSGWSDHESFEFAGIPAAWLEWRDDPRYHTTRDTASHVQSDKVRRTGRLVRGWLLDISAAELDALDS
ncbi:MAG: M28 family peptidase, partial [Coriobacteriia bacterium]|nr:M28 family peptidase [Coriobacteriia bacterium]